MITQIQDAGISCGFVGRTVKHVRDVRASDDVVIDWQYDDWVASSRGQEFRTAEEEWHALCDRYTAVVGPHVETALKAWGVRRERRSRN